MPAPSTEDATNRPSLSNPEGFAIIHDGIQPFVRYDPHDYQVEAITRVVNWD